MTYLCFGSVLESVDIGLENRGFFSTHSCFGNTVGRIGRGEGEEDWGKSGSEGREKEETRRWNWLSSEIVDVEVAGNCRI